MVENSAITANSGFLGGGITLFGGTVTIDDSTIAQNQAAEGGGLFNGSGGTLTVRNSTVTGNTAGFGGGIYNHNFENSILTVTDSIITQNTASVDGGGIYNLSTLQMTNTVVADNVPNDIAP